MIKTINDIYGEMLTLFARQSGYLPSVSCDLSARLYAAAAQLHALQVQAQWVLDQSFPQTAQGEYLDRQAALRGLTRGAATCAKGKLRFGVSDAISGDLPVEAGTVCMTAGGIRFVTTEDGVLPAGALYTDIPAQAVEPGKAGNTAANTITIMAAMPVGIRACTNPEPFAGGDNQESDQQLRQRVLDSYRRLPNGANAAYYEQAALSYTGVAAATAVGRPRGVGSVDLYVATDAGIPEPELLAEINGFLQKKREISVDLQVKAPASAPINIAVAIRPAKASGFLQARADAEAALRGAFTGALLGKSVTLAQLGNILYALDTVDNYRFSAPAADIAANPTVLPQLGELTITEMES